MDASADEYGRRIFSRHFDNVKEGTYQYKVRIGESQWVLDESKDTGKDSTYPPRTIHLVFLCGGYGAMKAKMCGDKLHSPYRSD